MLGSRKGQDLGGKIGIKHGRILGVGPCRWKIPVGSNSNSGYSRIPLFKEYMNSKIEERHPEGWVNFNNHNKKINYN